MLLVSPFLSYLITLQSLNHREGGMAAIPKIKKLLFTVCIHEDLQLVLTEESSPVLKLSTHL